MLDNINIENVLFLDIETVPAWATHENMPPQMQDLWAKKTEFRRQDKFTPEEFYNNAAIFAEFGKIVCISVGYFSIANSVKTLRIKSFSGHNEKEVLEQFSQLLGSHFSKRESTLCAHNGKEFDFPYIARRMLVNNVKLPVLLDIAGKKPWEVNLLDTMELWKFGDHKHYTSLNLLANVMGVPSPKDDIDGSMVGNVYWQEGDLPRIVSYCQKDVITIAQLFMRYKGEVLINTDNIVLC